jgi:hypothetical protein
VLHEVQLAPGQEVGSDPSHFREANRQFDAAMQSDPQFKQMMDQHYSGVSDHVWLAHEADTNQCPARVLVASSSVP